MECTTEGRVALITGSTKGIGLAGPQVGVSKRILVVDIGDGPIMNIPSGLGGPEPGPAGHLRQADRAAIALYIQVRDLRA